MLANDSVSACFFHNMKTAGHSIYAQLVDIPKLLQKEPEKIDRWYIILGMHGCYADLYNLDLDLYNKIKSYYKFCFIRNPFSHAVSLYYHVLDNHRWYKELHVTIDGKHVGEDDFKDFNNYLKNIYKCQTAHTLCDPYFMNDEWYRFETLQDSWDTLCDRLGYNRIKLSHINSTKDTNIFGLKYPSDYREMYDEKGKEIIYDRCRVIFDKFEYEF